MKKILVIFLVLCSITLCGCTFPDGFHQTKELLSLDCAGVWANDSMTIVKKEWFRDSDHLISVTWNEWTGEQELEMSVSFIGNDSGSIYYWVGEETVQLLAVDAELSGKQVILHVERDYGYEAGYYTVDHTGMDIVLDEQSRIY